MRKISLVVVAAMLLSAGNLLANNTSDEDKPNKTLVTQISKLLSKNTLTESEVDATAYVRFTVNAYSEIVVLSVKTENAVVESFVKAGLNYQKVDVTKMIAGKVYVMPVRIKG
ncbi:hypothetical protein [uncultured Maribacter sp.]|uniref:hypothetical protein n=1 Tax=uncultured Maribacter sp. TaxID=431308 RepID=UPI0026220EAD|nr:hypothetical protein [uncultured Maribacter sp.]